MSRPLRECDLAVVGAGILGLSVARELLQRHPAASVQVLEAAPRIAAHQTGHNSGVIHQGIYYRPGSLKARLCVDGAERMYAFCEEHGIPAVAGGKLIVAVDEGELGRLDDLERRGRANGVPGLTRLSAGEIRDVEPHARGLAALHSPRTGVVDYRLVAAALRTEVERGGGRVTVGHAVTGARGGRGGLVLAHRSGTTRAGHVVFCAGAWSDRLARMCGGTAEPRIVPFRGAYLRLRPERANLVRSMIYPVPDPALPFLGIHLTRHVDGEVGIGPSALLALGRDAYRARTVRPRDVASTATWPGAYRMARRWWRTGLEELHHAVRPSAFVADAARYVPALRRDDVLPGGSGVRAQAVGRDGSLIDDFVFSHTERALHVRNAPSPGATASLAIAEHIADELERVNDIPTPVKERS
jgi:(S)-2-hydroxyglutarate dehydrogenase